jgi:hypothetical protein
MSFAATHEAHPVGEYFADILVEDVLVIELKRVVRGLVCADREGNLRGDPPVNRD